MKTFLSFTLGMVVGVVSGLVIAATAVVASPEVRKIVNAGVESIEMLED